MAAGGSAQHEAQRSLFEAEALERMAVEARAKAQRYALASRTEAAVGRRLHALEQLGWIVLADRRWGRRANIDFLLVGPGGVLVLDVKAWRSLEVRNGSLFCEDDCRDEEADKVVSLADQVYEALHGLGLTPQAVRSLLVFSNQRLVTQARGVDLVGDANVASWATSLGQRLDGAAVKQIASLLATEFPPYDAPRPIRVIRPRVVVPAKTKDDELFDVEELADALLQQALVGPIESWMTFLHPDQTKLVRSTWNGPARIRGGAGTGKTVVGLHRAVYLAERGRRLVLFVTFVKTLPVVLRGLCGRLAPAAVDRIDFTGLHQLAVRLLDEGGVTYRIDPGRSETAFSAAWLSVGRGSVLERLDERPRYWKEELDYVIKGRGLTDFDDYADLQRLGRRTPMRVEHREVMWALYVEYERRRREAGVNDFNDLLIMARDLVQSGDVAAAYDSVIVDEVQDLALVGVELLTALAGEGPDRLLLIGDGQQAIYPGGFTLAEAGISVTGRASILRTNYRNTRQIMDFAGRVVAADSFDDLEGTHEQSTRAVEVSRTGAEPLVVRARDRVSLDAALVTQVLDTQERLRVPLGDMAVLVHTRAELTRLMGLFSRNGVPTVDLQDYDGVSSARLKVGTFKRAKGLEFKFVLIHGLTEGAPKPWAGEAEEAYQERAERMRREAYVGMTRARDGLWLGYMQS